MADIINKPITFGRVLLSAVYAYAYVMSVLLLASAAHELWMGHALATTSTNPGGAGFWESLFYLAWVLCVSVSGWRAFNAEWRS